MFYIQVDEHNRFISYDSNPTELHTIPIEDPYVIYSDPKYSPEDYIIKDSKLILDPLPETLERIAEQEKREEFLSSGPDTLSDQDDAVCALYEENLAIKETAAEQDDAICYLYEQLLKEGETDGK